MLLTNALLPNTAYKMQAWDKMEPVRLCQTREHKKPPSRSPCNHVYQHVLSTFAKVISVHKTKADHRRAYQLTWKLICVTQTLSCDILSFSSTPPPSLPLSFSLSVCLLFILPVAFSWLKWGNSFLENAPSNPCQCACVCVSAHMYACIYCICLCMHKSVRMCMCVYFSCWPRATLLRSELSRAVGCFRPRSKFNKPGLTYASILYKHCPVVGPAL